MALEEGTGGNCDAASSPSSPGSHLLVLVKGEGPGLYFTFEGGSLTSCFVICEA